MTLQNEWGVWLPDQPIKSPEEDKLWKEGSIVYRQAKDIARYITELGRESITIHVSGGWGTGKTSFLNLLEHFIRKEAKKDKDKIDISVGEDKGQSKSTDIVICRCDLPRFQTGEVEKGLAIQMLWEAAGGGTIEEVLSAYEARLLGSERGKERDRRGLIEAHELVEKLAERLIRLANLNKFFEDLLAGRIALAHSRRMIVLLDDVDRASPATIREMISILGRLSGVNGLFFVLAADREILEEAIQQQGEYYGFRNPQQVLEKYIQWVVTLPLIESPPKLEDFLEGFLVDPVACALRENLPYMAFLQHLLLLPLTPRKAKQMLNNIRYRIAEAWERAGRPSMENKEVIREIVTPIIKEAVLVSQWNDFYQRFFASPPSDPDTPLNHHQWAFSRLEGLCIEYLYKRAIDQDTFLFQAQRIFKQGYHVKEPLDLDKLLPEELIEFLSLEPYWYAQKPSMVEEPKGLLEDRPSLLKQREVPETKEIKSIVPEDVESQLTNLFIQARAAIEENMDYEACLHRLEEAYQLASTNTEQLDARGAAPTVGNLALTAERIRSYDLAEKLYKLALEFDPNHSNNLQNYADFIITKRRKHLYEEVENILKKLQAPPHDAHRPARTLLLWAQLNKMLGKQVDVNVPDRLWQFFRQDPTDKVKFVSLMLFLEQIPDVKERIKRVHEAVELYKAHAKSDGERYVADRGLADFLAAHGGDGGELEAMNLYRWLVEIKNDGQADAKHNYATLLAKHGYDDEAARQWFEAYQLKRQDPTIRRAYSVFLLRYRRTDLANDVAQGKSLKKPFIPPSTKPLPSKFLPEQGGDGP
jgi:Flp pilus assembly protein TadD